MDKDSMQALRFDRRLATRKGHVKPAEAEEYLEALPDVSDKMAPRDDAERGAEATQQAPEATPGAAFTPTSDGSGQ